MAKQGTKRFSLTRYWTYVFTPLLLLTFFFGIFMLYTQGTAPAIRKVGLDSLVPSAGLEGLVANLKTLEATLKNGKVV